MNLQIEYSIFLTLNIQLSPTGLSKYYEYGPSVGSCSVCIFKSDRSLDLCFYSEAKEILQKRVETKAQREAELLKDGYPGKQFLEFALENCKLIMRAQLIEPFIRLEQISAAYLRVCVFGGER